MALTFFRHQPRILNHARIRPTSGPYPAQLEELLPRSSCASAIAEIKRLPEYSPTPLHDLALLAGALGLESVHYKNEGDRFGLGSFKPLAGAYPLYRMLANRFDLTVRDIHEGRARAQAEALTVTAAADPNYGRAIAWAAHRAGCRCRIYIGDQISDDRARAIAEAGAEIVRVDGDYGNSVQACRLDSVEHGWITLSDISRPDYEEVPKLAMAGCSLIADEILAQTESPVTHVFVPTGSGGLAAALAARFWMEMGAGRPRFVIVESEHAACFTRSAKRGALSAVRVRHETIMTGLSGGKPSLLAWEVLRRAASDFVTIPDTVVTPTLKMLASGRAGGGKIKASGCAAAGPAALIGIASNQSLRESIGLDYSSRVVLIGTEGPVDPAVSSELLSAE